MLAHGFLTHQRKKTRGIVRALAAFLIILVVTTYGSQAICQMVSFKLEDSLSYNLKDPGNHGYSLVMDTKTLGGDQLLQELASTPGITDLQVTYSGMWAGQTPPDTYSAEYWEDFYQICSLYYPEGISREEVQDRFLSDRLCQVNLLAVDQQTFQAMLTAVQATPPWQRGTPASSSNRGSYPPTTWALMGERPWSIAFTSLRRCLICPWGRRFP